MRMLTKLNVTQYISSIRLLICINFYSIVCTFSTQIRQQHNQSDSNNNATMDIDVDSNGANVASSSCNIPFSHAIASTSTSMPTNITATKHQHQQPSICNECSKNQATRECFDCRAKYCDKCFGNIHSFKTFSNHHHSAISSTMACSSLLANGQCEQHQQKCQHYCNKCRLYLCVVCIRAHQKHSSNITLVEELVSVAFFFFSSFFNFFLLLFVYSTATLT